MYETGKKEQFDELVLLLSAALLATSPPDRPNQVHCTTTNNFLGFVRGTITQITTCISIVNNQCCYRNACLYSTKYQSSASSTLSRFTQPLSPKVFASSLLHLCISDCSREISGRNPCEGPGIEPRIIILYHDERQLHMKIN